MSVQNDNYIDKNNINGFNPNQYEIPIQNNFTQEQNADYTKEQNLTSSNKPLIVDNKGYYDEDEESFSEEVKQKSNLLFDEKQVSPFKLYCHLSESYEILLMIL